MPNILSLVTFFRGRGDGQDMVYRWKVENGIGHEGSWVIAWTDTPILIVGYQLVKLKGQKHDWFMVGNSFTPDCGGFMGPKEDSMQLWYPAGSGQLFPPAPNDKAYIDIHGAGWGEIVLALTIFYHEA